MSKELEEQIAKAGSDDYIRAVIAMKDKLPVSEITALADGKSRAEAGKLVITRLKELSLQSQRNVLDVLKTAKATDEVRNMRSIYSVNKIVITAKKSFFEQVKNRSDINSIYYEKPSKAVGDITWNVEKIRANRYHRQKFKSSKSVYQVVSGL